MVFDVSIVVTWLLFLALFPMAFLWLRRAWRIFIKHNYEEVALKGGEAPSDAEKWAPYTGMINLAAGAVAVTTILGVAGGFFSYKTWSAMAGMTLWVKIFADFIVSRQAHPFTFGKKKRQ
ncbi:MAG: hypothetical protein C0617_13895 [Desulfuromonas sp.]|uniref:hypothetical protein n=1 Tax=Desulfuromonas sp. TaxID=892 RepID=UPI000CBA78FE|nr:hypothetical protein [Desulfuromonas sp.]PLX82519.1 MAG: hypothetical protein C0617_13895 [Desulfuromonas sp.]